MKEKYIVIANNYSLWKYLFSDIEKVGGDIFIYPLDDEDGRRKRFIYKFCCNKLCKKILNPLWDKYIIRKHLSDRMPACLIFQSDTVDG